MVGDTKFVAGDFVQTKVGGPKMVIDKVTAWSGHETQYTCIWWIGQKMSRETFHESSLAEWKE